MLVASYINLVDDTKSAGRTLFAPKIDSADVITINGITMLQQGTGYLFAGQVPQYEDIAGIQTIM